MNDVLHNWAANVEFRPARVHRPSTLDGLRRVVAEAGSVRVLGTGHSFNRIADTAGDLVLVDGLPAEVRIDPEARTATVPAGLRLADLAQRLHAAGFALANLPSLPHISLAGACATGTHGSGDANQGLAGMVRAIQMVGAEGDVLEFVRDESADFAGVVVALGALGVVSSLTLDLEPGFQVAQHVYQDVPLDPFLERHADVFASGYSVSAFTNWADGRASVWQKVRVAEDNRPGAAISGAAIPGAAGGGDVLESLGGRPARQALHPVPGMPAENCTPQGGVPGPWHERLPHFRPSSPRAAGGNCNQSSSSPGRRPGPPCRRCANSAR